MNKSNERRHVRLRIASLTTILFLVLFGLVRPALNASRFVPCEEKSVHGAPVSVRHTVLDVTDANPEQRITEFARSSAPTPLLFEIFAARPVVVANAVVMFVPARLVPRRRLASRRTCDRDPFV